MTFPGGTLIFDAYQAWLGICRTALPDVLVLDGPQPTYDASEDVFIVGCDDPTSTGLVRAVDGSQQDWVSLGAFDREETYSILNSIVIWLGDNDLPQARTRAKAIVANLAAALYPPPHGTGDAMLGNTLNRAGNGTGWCGLTAVGPVNQIQTSAGTGLHVAVVLGCTNRL